MYRGKERITTENLVKRMQSVHGDRYDYSLVKYINAKTKVKLVCKEHGVFEISPFVVLKGSGCPKCAGKGLSTKEIVDKIKKIHGVKYDYSKVNYVRSNEKICLICPIHGEFYITTSKIFNRKDGCPKCGKQRAANYNTLAQEKVIEKFKDVHGDRYDYSNVIYSGMHEKIDIICKKHGIFCQLPYDHINGHGCPKCSNINSRMEDEIADILAKHLGDCEIYRHDRSVLDGKEIDIYIPRLGIGIEYNGLYWHSEKFCENKFYHRDKMLLSNNKGVKLIHIFEDEYLKNKSLIINKILHILGYNNSVNIIYGRDCTVQEITKNDSKIFLEENHIQGNCKCTVSYGCFYDGKLCGVMSFLKNGDNNYQLVRFASDNNFRCIDIEDELFSYFLKEKNPKSVKAIADLRWLVDLDNNLYTKLRFKKDKILDPGYMYIGKNNPRERISRFNFRKIEKRNSLLNLSEKEMAEGLGYYRIYDCGHVKYIWIEGAQ